MRTSDVFGNFAAVRNSVIRNTYWLLALTMIPTVFGAYLGVTLGLPAISGLGWFVVFGILIGFIIAINALKNSAAGIPVLLLFTFFMGAMLTPLLVHTLTFSNGGLLIMLAAGGTGAIFAVLATFATVTKRDFSGMGTWLFIALLVLVGAGILNIFLQLPILTLACSAVAVLVFSAYILYDVQQIVNGGETSYIAATLNLYLDVLNIFSGLLNLLGAGFGDD